MRPSLQKISVLRAWAQAPHWASRRPTSLSAQTSSRRAHTPAVAPAAEAGSLARLQLTVGRQPILIPPRAQFLIGHRNFCSEAEAEAEDNLELKEEFKIIIDRIQIGVLPRRHSIFKFLEQCRTKKDLRRAFVIVDRYKPWMTVKCVRTGSLLIRAAIRAGEFDAAIKILHDHRQMRFRLSASVGKDLLDELGAAGEIDKMIESYKILATFVPGIVHPETLVIMIRAMLRNDEGEKAVEFFEQWRIAGSRLKPVSYKVLLEGFNSNLAKSEEGEARDALLKSRDRVKDFLQKDNLLKDPTMLQLLQYMPPTAAGPEASQGGGEPTAEEVQEQAKA